MARKPVDTRLPTELLQPQAAPVDAYVQPPRSGLRDFADALGKIDRPLKQFLDARAEKQAKEDRIRGEAAFYSDNSEAIAEGVRSGKINAQYSPAFVKGFKNAQGYVAGNKLKADFNAAFDAWDGKNSEDPAAFDTFMAEFLKGRVDTDDPEVLRGLVPHVRQLADEGFNRYETYRHDQTVKGSLNAHVAAANMDVDEFNREGLSTEEGTNYPAVFAAIEDKRAAFIASGGNPDAFDQAMTDAMSAKVLALRDPGLLAWFDQKVPGKNFTYGDTPYGAKVKLETTESLEVIARRSVSEDAARQKLEDEKRKDDATRQAIDYLITNPAAPMPDGILKLGEVDPKFKVNIEEWRGSLNRGFSDPKRIQGVYDAILNGGGMKAITDAWANGVFGRPEDLQAAYAFQKSFEDNADRITAVTTGATFERFMRDITIRTQWKVLGDPIAGTSNEGYEAQYDFRRMVTEWVIDHPNATSEEREVAVNKVIRSIMDRLVPVEDADMSDEKVPGATYERDPSLSFENPFTEGTAPMRPAGDGGLSPTATPPAPGDSIRGLLDGLSPEQREAVKGRADALGLTPEDFARKYLLGGEKRTDARDWKPLPRANPVDVYAALGLLG